MRPTPDTLTAMPRNSSIAKRLLPIVLLTGGCNLGGGSSARSVPATDVIVRPAALTLRAGESSQLAAQANDTTGQPIGGAALRYESLAPTLVHVTASGAVTAMGPVGAGSVSVASDSAHRFVGVVVLAGAPRFVTVLAGGNQSGPVGSTLPEPLSLRVTDAYGNPVVRATVSFQVGSGGTIEPGNATTDASGVARAIWTLGHAAGVQVVTADIDSVTVSAEATAEPGALASVEPLGVLRGRVSAGDTVPVRLRARDAFGNGVPRVLVTITVAAGEGSVDSSRIETAADGLIDTRWATGTRAGENVLVVHASEARDTTFRITVRTVGGRPASLTLVAGDAQRADSGSAVRVPPRVRVADRFGNPVASARVRFVVSAGGGSVEPPEAITDEQGVAAVGSWRLGARGENILSASVEGVADTVRVTARSVGR